jgi:hypothetical protein
MAQMCMGEGELESDAIADAMQRVQLELVDIRMHHAFPSLAKPPGVIKGMSDDEAAMERYVAWCRIWVAMAEAHEKTVDDTDISQQGNTQATIVDRDRQFALWRAVHARMSEAVTHHSVAAREHAAWLTQWTDYAETELRHMRANIDDVIRSRLWLFVDVDGPNPTEGISALGRIKRHVDIMKTQLDRLRLDRKVGRATTARLADVGRSAIGRAGGPEDPDVPVVGAGGPSPLAGSLFQALAERGRLAYREIGRMQRGYAARDPAMSQEFKFTEARISPSVAEDATSRARLELIDIEMYHEFPCWARPPGEIEKMPPDDAAVERYVAWCDIWVAMAKAYESTVGDCDGLLTWRPALRNAINTRRYAEVTRFSTDAVECSDRLAQWTDHATDEMDRLYPNIDYLWRLPSHPKIELPVTTVGTTTLMRTGGNLDDLKAQLGSRYPNPGTRRAYKLWLAAIGESGFALSGGPLELDVMVVGYVGPNPLTGSLFQILAERGHRAYREIGRMQRTYDASKRKRTRPANADGDEPRHKAFASIRDGGDETANYESDDDDGKMRD